MLQETTITMPLMQIINAIGNVAIFVLALYVKWQISKLEKKMVEENTDTEEKILSTVNGKYMKTEVYNEQHKNLIEKVEELKTGQKEISIKIDNFLAHTDSRLKQVDKKLLLLSAIPCPFQEQKKFLIEND